MQDGSGLSPRNGISPMQLATMLRAVALDTAWFTSFYSSLPEPKTGTMKGYVQKHPLSIWAASSKKWDDYTRQIL